MHHRLPALLALLVLIVTARIGLADDFPANGAFAPLEHWTTQGQVVPEADGAFESKLALRFERAADKLVDTSATSNAFKVEPGNYDIGAAIRSDLYTQDMSFNVALTVDFQDAAGKSLQKQLVAAVSGKTAWRLYRKRVSAPPGTTQARLTAQINKTWGKAWLDAVTVRPAPAGVAEATARVTFGTRYVGNLFYPEDRPVIWVNVQTPDALDQPSQVVTWDVRDYWGAPICSAQTATLHEVSQQETPPHHEYAVALDAGTLPLQVGPYYELHTSQKIGTFPALENATSFAILPQSSAFKYDVLQLPFGTHSWDDRVPAYFTLSARLGLRRCASFWGWPATAPYMPDYAGAGFETSLGLPKKLGMAPYATNTPPMQIEQGKNKYTDEAIREGTRLSIEKFAKDGLWGFQLGNEPPSGDPKMVARDVELYKLEYETIKKADPKIIAIGSAIGPSEEFFKAGFGQYCDVYNIHAYSDLGELRRAMHKYRELFDKYGGKKPIWSTEIGSFSQGLTRHEIAMDILRKASCFFADGGEFFSWFAITYPDPAGTRRNTYGDSMDLFAGYLEQFNPRLDAVAYFHFIDLMGNKKFAKEVTYDNGTTGMLFHDEQGNCLQLLWNLTATNDVFVSLKDVYAARVMHVDGKGASLDAAGEGVTLRRFGEEPIMVSYRQNTPELADKFGEPKLMLKEAPKAVFPGVASQVVLAASSGGAVELVGPPMWKIQTVSDGKQADGTRLITFKVDVPADTPARAAQFAATIADAGRAVTGDVVRGETRFRLPIQSRIDADILPIASTEPGKAGMELVVRNNGDTPQSVQWKVEIASETPMYGEFKFDQAEPASAYFTDAAEGRIDLTAGEEKRLRLGMAKVEPLTLYQMHAQVIDAGGKTIDRQRLMGGFIGVPHVHGPITIDGSLDEPEWSKAPVLKIDDARQFWSYVKTIQWHGPKDLSADVRVMWDEQNLYIGAKVTDDVFLNTKSDGQLWNGDGLQFLFDPYRDRLEKLGRYDYSVAIGTKGPQAWCSFSGDGRAPSGEAKEIHVAGKPFNDGTGGMTYEIAIPWIRLAPFTPTPGRNLGMGLIVNDDDGQGRHSFLGWFGGVHSKVVNQVGDLILQPGE